jgi:hypothetical protein
MFGAGLVICAAWFLMTVSGMVGDAAALRSRRIICLILFRTPSQSLRRNRLQSRAGGIHRLTLLVIGVFILMYLGLGFVRLASV